MSALLDSLATAFDGGAEQRAALDTALQTGLPGARNEAWKYTSLRALERRSFAAAPQAAPAIDASLLAKIPSPRLVFVNGRHAPQYSALDALSPGVRLSTGATTGASPRIDEGRPDADVFARLNFALAEDGIALHVDDGMQVEQPLHLVFVGTPAEHDLAWHLRHRLTLGADARLAVIEHHLRDGEHAHLGNSVTFIELGARAQLLHTRIQDESTRATLLSRTEAVLGESAGYRRIDLELGAALSRHVLNVQLEGQGASLACNGVLLASGRQHSETRLGVAHVARDTRCELTWRGLAAGRARVVFHGGIVIHAGADGSDARLSNKNLLLGDNAEIDTQPVLEIHADEVKAAHGATVGQLDPTALFYLRSRGLTEADARRLLTAAFCREVILGVDAPDLRACLEQAVDRALSRMESA
jgi:Fe-S cluster assembly protein SufD